MSTCNYCDGEVEWLELAAGQRWPFDAPPKPVLGKAPPWPPPLTPPRDLYVLERGAARRATAEDVRLLRPIYRRHDCRPRPR